MFSSHFFYLFILYYSLFAYIIEKDEKNIFQSLDGKIVFVLKKTRIR